MARQRALPAFAWGAAAAGLVAGGVWALFGRVPLSYDSYFALLWGRDLAHGRAPQYDLPFASTPHPLFNAIGTLLAPLGHGAEAGLRGVVLLALGAAAVAVFRIGREIAGPAAGVLAAAILATRAPVLEAANRASLDLLALALLAWAVSLELSRPRRGTATMALLMLAGLLRPEAWLLSAAYWVWLARSLDPRRRIRLALLGLAAPAVWIGTDLLVTGDAFWSGHQTAVKASDTPGVTGLDALGHVPRQVGSILRIPELAAAVAGVAIAVALRIRRAAIPAAVVLLSALGAVALAIDGQTILQRFFFLPAAMLAVFAALAVLGWAKLDRGHPSRRRLQPAGLALGVALAVGAPFDVDRVADSRDGLRADERLQAKLRDLAVTTPVQQALRSCRPDYVPAGGTIPFVAFWSDSRPGAFDATPPPPAHGTIVVTARTADANGLPYPLPAPAPPPAGYRPVARNGSWVVLRAC